MKDNLQKRQKDGKSDHLNALVKAISDCGITFNVWEKRNADGKGSGVHDFTSLMGTDKRLLMKYLPDKLKECVRPNHIDALVRPWQVLTSTMLRQNN